MINIFSKQDAHKSIVRTKPSYLQDIKAYPQLYAFILPFFILYIIMVVLPIGAAIMLSFTYYNLFNFPEWIGLTNYINLFLNDDVFYIALKNTIFFALITGPLSFFLCYVVSWLINEMPHKVRVFLTIVFYAPSLSSSLFFVWQFVFSGDSYGFANGILMSLGLVQEPIQWLTDPKYNLSILMFVQLWMSLGVSFLAFIAGFQGVDKTLYEAGDIDGIKNRFQRLIYITIPLMKPQLLFGAIMQIAAALSVSTISMQLCGFPSTKYSAHTIVLHMMDYGTIRYEMGYACAIAVVLFVLMLLFKKGVSMMLKYVSDSQD